MMVKLSAMTVDESAGYEISSSGGGGQEELLPPSAAWGEEIVCGIPARRIKILLTNDLRQTTGEDSHQEGANVDAWYDRDGTVFVLIDNGNDVCYLEAEEYEAMECIEDKEVIEDEEKGDDVAESTTPSPLGATVAFQQEIANASALVATCAVEWARAQDAAKSAKKQFEGAVEDLRSIIGRGPEVMPLFDQAAAKATTATAIDTPDPTDESWRETPISEIFLGIRGLGAKKREAIQAMIPTLGAFEDLRKKASLEGNPLQDYMPKGVGQEACDQLEEASLNAISRIMTLGDDDEDEDEGDDEGGEA